MIGTYRPTKNGLLMADMIQLFIFLSRERRNNRTMFYCSASENDVEEFSDPHLLKSVMDFQSALLIFMSTRQIKRRIEGVFG